jgi:hypothetical protein
LSSWRRVHRLPWSHEASTAPFWSRPYTPKRRVAEKKERRREKRATGERSSRPFGQIAKMEAKTIHSRSLPASLFWPRPSADVTEVVGRKRSPFSQYWTVSLRA